ncbi:MAG: polysaccharide deacetylase family protein [Lentisphaeria bacterium]|jgi:hypothetical protein|nr:polysaccharide deacetylase family protein [Lentisphaeria bacterium]MDP7742632.1 polysaccharide deacetylase family protein [Lentisphaeria bacterium]
MQLFFNYSIDCETPANTDYTGPERRPFFRGPETWELAERSVRGFVERMEALGVRDGTTLFVYPDVARHQRSLYCEMAAAGIEIALHLNGLRYSKLRGDQAQWLGEMSREAQRHAIGVAKQDLEETLGQPCDGYRACYGSANGDTFALCEELGFTWTSNAGRRYRPEFGANWSGSWPYAHHASARSNLICGSLRLFEIPVTVGLQVYFDESIRQPLDLRVETPPEHLGEQRQKLAQVIEENLVEMARRDVPVRAIIGLSHNVNDFADTATYQSQNLDWVVRYTRELAAASGYSVEPAKFTTMTDYGLQVGSY